MLSKLDRTIIDLVSRDIPLTDEPFEDLAGRIGIEEKVLLARIRVFKKSGLMRKFSAVLNHKKIGFKHNAMVVWNVPEALIDRAGSLMASFDEVSHCYRRKKPDGWDYNLYSMVHGRTRRSCLAVVRKIDKELGGNVEHKALFSSKEEKKTAARF